MDEKKWLCKCGAALGAIVWNGDGVPQLLIYRHAVDMNEENPAEVEVLGPLTGRMPVQCDACGEVSVWSASAKAILGLLDGMNEKQLTEFVEEFLEKWAPLSPSTATSPQIQSADLGGKKDIGRP